MDQRSGPIDRSGRDHGAGFDQFFGGAAAPLGQSEHQGVPDAVRILDLDVSLGLEEGVDDEGLAVVGRQHERRPTGAGPLVDLGPARDQRLHVVILSFPRGEHERRLAVLVLRLDRHLRLDQSIDRLLAFVPEEIAHDGEHQRGVSVLVLNEGVRALLESRQDVVGLGLGSGSQQGLRGLGVRLLPLGRSPQRRDSEQRQDERDDLPARLLHGTLP